jgi:hypothetical protein
MKKEVAPVSLMKHFFSFLENFIQRIYRRQHEISPQIEAFYLGGERKQAVQLSIRELEGIVKDVMNELLKAMKKEGYQYKHESDVPKIKN